MNYYNEIDPYAAQWLRNLIAAGHIPRGEVDERSIVDVRGSDLRAYTQCHFFAGIAGWALALHLAGWPENKPVWTGSCPCQPFSVAGKGLGEKDPRHLWPAWFDLIRECRPEYVLGEQVEGAVRHGWLDGVCADLEGEGYTVGAAVLGAHSVGAPHIRQRLWWVGYADSQRQAEIGEVFERQRTAGGRARLEIEPVAYSAGVQHPASNGRQQRGAESSQWGAEFGRGTDGKLRRVEPSIFPLAHGIPRGLGLVCPACIQANPKDQDGVSLERTPADACGICGRQSEWLAEAMISGTRIGRLRAYGNAIVPQVAAEFIGAVMECLP